MRTNNLARLLLPFMLACSSLAAGAQVLTPSDLDDAQCRHLQQQYMPQLIAAGERVAELQFPYRFYLSRAMDLSEQQQRLVPQASIHFDKFGKRVVLRLPVIILLRIPRNS